MSHGFREFGVPWWLPQAGGIGEPCFVRSARAMCIYPMITPPKTTNLVALTPVAYMSLSKMVH